MSDRQNFSVFPCLSSKEEVLAFINRHVPLRNFYESLSVLLRLSRFFRGKAHR